MPQGYAPLPADEAVGSAAPSSTAAAAPSTSTRAFPSWSLPQVDIPPRLQAIIDSTKQTHADVSKRFRLPVYWARYLFLVVLSWFLALYAYNHLGFSVNIDLFGPGSFLTPNMPPVRSVG